MAQAFEIPKGWPESASWPPRDRPRREPPRSTQQRFVSRSPLPVRPVGRVGTWNMGPPPGHRKRIDTALARPATGPIPGSAIRAKVNRFYRIW